jgi:CRP-like cAMP-binding protein
MSMDNRDIAVLASSPLFVGVDVKELAQALAGTKTQVHSFAAGRVVLLSGCAYAELRVILEGECTAEMTSGEGKTVIIETLGPGAALATAVLFTPDARLPVTLVAKSELRLASIPKDVFLSLCARFPPLLAALLDDMGRRVAFLTDKYRSLSFASLRERIADWLLRSAERRPEGVEVRLATSKERLAAVFGVARPSLSRELGELVSRGLIEMKGRRIRILDEAGLMALRPR